MTKWHRKLNSIEENRIHMWPFHYIGKAYRSIMRYGGEIGLSVLAGFLFFVATNTQSGWLYFIVAMIGALLLMTFIQGKMNLRKLRIKRKFAGVSSEDGKINVKLILINESRFPKYMLLLQDQFPSLEPDKKDEKIVVTYIPGRERVEVSYSVRCYSRGILRFGEILIESMGLLGLFYTKKKIRAENERLIVFPRTYRLDHFILDNVSPYFAREEKTCILTGKSHDFLGIQEYSPGQEIRCIHWPSSAKQGKLMIKEFKEIATHSMSVVLDTHIYSDIGKGRESTTEDIIRTSATLLKSAKKRRYTYDLYSHIDSNLIIDKNLSSKKGMYRLAELDSNSEFPLEQDLFEVISRVQALDHLYILKTYPFENLDVIKKTLERRIFTIVIFFNPGSYIDDDELDEDAKKIKGINYDSQLKELREIGISAYVYNKGTPLNELLTFRRPVNAVPYH
ncbi:MAG: DUF58 domain-containing protein [Candidatus Eremiobacteraeota bacterium]|nr:DUF58 domain-containing protein [Candidatus Eremiobacteraeota bacterium]